MNSNKKYLFYREKSNMRRNSSLFYIYIREQSNTIVLLLNIRKQGTWNRFVLQLKCSKDVAIPFDSYFNHFYSDLCTQSPENQLFPLPEKEDGEQHPEGNELLSLV